MTNGIKKWGSGKARFMRVELQVVRARSSTAKAYHLQTADGGPKRDMLFVRCELGPKFAEDEAVIELNGVSQ
jgi:hypothetical protein